MRDITSILDMKHDTSEGIRNTSIMRFRVFEILYHDPNLNYDIKTILNDIDFSSYIGYNSATIQGQYRYKQSNSKSDLFISNQIMMAPYCFKIVVRAEEKMNFYYPIVKYENCVFSRFEPIYSENEFLQYEKCIYK